MYGALRSRSALVSLALVLLPIACSDSTAPDPDTLPDSDPGPGGSGPAASVVIKPGAVLLTGAGETMQLAATVLDAAGQPVQAAVTWRSNDPGTVSVSGAGLATAAIGLGSAQITAVAQGVESAPALAVVARPAAGVVLIPDAQIVSDPVAVDPAAEYGTGWRYRIRVTGDAPDVGQLVLGTGGRSLAGRVVGATAQGTETELIVELVALNQLFADLAIDEEIPLVEMEAETGGLSWWAAEPGWEPADFGAADTEFTLGRFKCTSSAGAPDLDLPNPTLDIDPDLSLSLGYANGLEKYAVVGSITADFGYKPVFKATFEGKVGCESVLRTVTLPLGGFLAWFVGVQVPLGVGFELDGKLEIAEVGFDVSAHAEATAELGLLCPAAGGSCSGLTSFEAERDFEFEFIAPDPTEQFKLTLGAKGFVFARPSVGSAFSASTQFAFLEATAGLAQTVDLATATHQVSDTAYASGFKLEGQIDVGPGKDLTSAIDRLGNLLGVDLDVDLTLVDIDETLAESPKGSFTIDPASVQPGDGTALGDMATFTIELDPVTYLGLEAVDSVEIFWKKDDGNEGFTLEPGRPGCTDISGSSGQTTFTCQTDFLEEHAGEQTFYAFVHAKMFGVPVPLPLEISDDAVAKASVGTAAPAGVIPVWNASRSRAAAQGEEEVVYADSADFSGFAANASAVSASTGTVSVSTTQNSIFHQAAATGYITFLESRASASLSIAPDGQGRSGAGTGENVLYFMFDVSGQPVDFAFQGDFSAPSDSSANGPYFLYLDKIDSPTANMIHEQADEDLSIVREGTLPPGRYRLSVRQLVKASTATDGEAASTWDVRLEFHH